MKYGMSSSPSSERSEREPRTDKDAQIDALKRSLAHAQSQVEYFNKAGQHWARDLGKAETLLREAMEHAGNFECYDGSPEPTTFDKRVERCLPGFWARTTRDEADDV